MKKPRQTTLMTTPKKYTLKSISINHSSCINHRGTPLIMLISLLSFVLFFMLSTGELTVAMASSFEDIIDEEFISFYESKISKSPVITNMDEKTLEAIMSKYGLTENRLKFLLVLESFGKVAGCPKNFDELTEMTDNKLILYVERLIKTYSETIDEAQKKELEEEFQGMLKRKFQQPK